MSKPRPKQSARPTVSRLDIGGGRYVRTNTEDFFRQKIYWLSCFCGWYDTPRSTSRNQCVDVMVKHISEEHPEALRDFSEADYKREEEKVNGALLFLEGASTILSDTNLTPREEQVGRYTRRKGGTRDIPTPTTIAKRLQNTKPTAPTDKSKGATEVGFPNGRVKYYFGTDVFRYLVEREGKTVFVQDIMAALNLTRGQVQNVVSRLIRNGEPIHTSIIGNAWVFDTKNSPQAKPTDTVKDPVVQKIVEQKYGDDPVNISVDVKTPIVPSIPHQAKAPTIETETMVVLSRKNGQIILVDAAGTVWRALPMDMG